MQYAMRIEKSDLALVTFLNDGVEPEIEIEKKPTFLILEINGPTEITTKVVTQREFLSTYDITLTSTLLLHCTK